MTSQPLDVAVIGTGFSGLGMAIQLRKKGFQRVRVFEKAADVGGTWRDNTYPGCGCDVKSALYSYSFEPYARWSNVYAKQGEILDYIRHCADKYQVRPWMAFNSPVRAAQWDDVRGLWTLTVGDGEQQHQVEARAVVAAPGPFAEPKVAAIPGRDRFQGAQLHTGRWDPSVSLKGQRVGLIGTGATAVQVGPAIVDQVAALAVFQRTANWIMPRPDRAITPREKTVYTAAPLAMLAPRLGQYWFNELTAPFLILADDRFKQYPERIARSYLAKKVADPELRRRLTPNFKFGCKRVLVSSDWYKMMQRDHVTLYDHHADNQGIAEINETGVRLNDGTQVDLDVLIFATGYEVRSTGAPFPVIGRQGQSLGERWKDGAEAYQGMTTHGFPNFFTLVGPFTGPGHTSVIAYAEKQIDYVCQALQLMQSQQLKSVEVKAEVEAAFVRQMDERSGYTVWKSGCDSWYLSPNGRNNTLYPGFNFEYRLRVARFNPAQYHLTTATGTERAARLSDHLRTAAYAITA